MKSKLADERINYTGRELRSHWVMERFGLEGDVIVAFRGSCMVSGEDLVDREDFDLGNVVAGKDMLHFIVEMSGAGLLGITLAQRLLCSITQDVLNSELSKSAAGRVVDRKGDDLYVGQGKLSVSVATVSPVSGLIHLGLNITTEGVPVEAACLAGMSIDYKWIAGEVLARFAGEIDSCTRAASKVRPVV